MKRNRKISVFEKLSGFLLMAFLILASCSTSECFENKNSLPLAGFYSSGTNPQAIALDSISIYGIGAPGDSILEDSVRGLSQSYLPFRIDEGQTTYVIKYLAGILGLLRIADTITFNYEIVPWFESAGCGVIYDYKMTSIETTHYIIDSVTCPTGEITNKNVQNLHIYFRVGNGSDDGTDDNGEEENYE